MPDIAALSVEVRQYLGTDRRTWELRDTSAPWRRAELYAAAEVPRVEFEVSASNLTPIQETKGPRESSSSAIVAYDLIATLDDDTDAFGALMWFPSFGEFGSWYAPKQCVLLYPGIDLSDVLPSPSDYIFAFGLRQGRIEPYACPPWIQQSLDEERFQALIVHARKLQRQETFQPNALKFALLATDQGRGVSEQHRQAADYVVNKLLRALRDYDGVVALCDRFLESLPLAPPYACALVNEAARHECNAGNELAAIARLERAVNEPAYSEFHNRFRTILDRIRNAPPT